MDFRFSEDQKIFISNALSPAKVNDVSIEGETATVTVDADQLSLAIGKEGQNVRLAWKLTGIKIDIEGPEGEKAQEPVLDDIEVKSKEELESKKVSEKTEE